MIHIYTCLLRSGPVPLGIELNILANHVVHAALHLPRDLLLHVSSVQAELLRQTFTMRLKITTPRLTTRMRVGQLLLTFV